MRITLMALAVMAALPAGRALADDDCDVPLKNWQPRDAVTRVAQENGWSVRRIKIDDGCYEIKGRDDQGREIKAKIDPATLRIIKVKYKDDDDDHRRRDKDHDDRKRDDDHDDRKRDEAGKDAVPAIPSAPPHNGLFGSGAPPRVQVK